MRLSYTDPVANTRKDHRNSCPAKRPHKPIGSREPEATRMRGHVSWACRWPGTVPRYDEVTRACWGPDRAVSQMIAREIGLRNATLNPRTRLLVDALGDRGDAVLASFRTYDDV